MSEMPLLIAGGGIGGLTAAIALAHAGRKVVLAERALKFEPIGYGIQIGPNAFHVFEKQGLSGAVRERCVIPERGLLSDALTNAQVVELPMGERMIARFGQPYAVIHRGDLHDLLLEACDRLPNVALVNDFDVTGVAETGSGVTLSSAGGATMEGTALIAADGIWSALRNQLFPGTPPPFASRYVAFRGLVPVEQVPSRLLKNEVNLRCGDDFHMINYMLRAGTLFNVVAGMRVPDAIAMDDNDAVIAAFGEILARGCGEVRELVEYIDQSRYWVVSNLVPIHQWTKGRVALLGDSAHAMVQAMAQGACQAIEDAFVLAKHLADDAPVETAFERYHAERYMRATYVQYRSLYMWELIHAKGGWRDLRQVMLGRMSEVEVYAQLDWLYSNAPGSALAGELDWQPRAFAAA